MPRHRILALVALCTLLIGNDARADNGALAIAFPVEPITLDGDFSDWPETLPKYDLKWVPWGDTHWNKDDLRGHFQVAHNRAEGKVYLAVRLTDDHALPGDKIIVRLGAKHSQGNVVGPEIICEFMADQQPSFHGKVFRKQQDHGFVAEIAIDLQRYIQEQALPVGAAVYSFSVEVIDVDPNDSVSSITWSPGKEKGNDGRQQGDLLIGMPESSGKVLGQVVGESGPTTPGMVDSFLVKFKSLENPDLALAIRADSTGKYQLPLPPGKYERTVPNHSVPKAILEVKVGETTDDTFRIPTDWSPGSLEFGAPSELGAGFLTRDGRFDASGAERAAKWESGTLYDKEPNEPLEPLLEENLSADSHIYRAKDDEHYFVTRQFGPADGFPDAVIRKIVQTDDRTLWLATDQGLYTLRANRIAQVQLPRTQKGLSLYKANSPEGEQLWYGTSSGCFVLNLKQGSVVDVPFLRGKCVNAIAQDPQGRILIGTDWGLYRKQKSSEGFRKVKMPSVGHVFVSIRALACDVPRGLVWVGTDHGLWRTGGKQWTREPLGPQLDQRITCLYLSGKGKLWIGTGRSIVTRIGKHMTSRLYGAATSQDLVQAVYETGSRVIVGCRNGLVSHPHGTHVKAAVSPLPDDAALTAMHLDQDGNLLLATSSKQLLFRQSWLSHFTDVPCSHVVHKDRFVWFISRQQDGTSYIHRYGSILSRRPFLSWQLPVGTEPTQLLVESPTTAYIGTKKNGVLMLSDATLESGTVTPHPVLNSGHIRSLTLSHFGPLCVAAEGVDGLHDEILYYRDNRIGHTPEVVGLGVSHGAIARHVLRTEWDSARKRRLVLLPNQLLIVEGEDVRRLGVAEGLPTGINELCCAKNGDIWLATDDGVVRYDGNSFHSYDLHGKSYLASSFVREDNEGRIWAGISSGIVRVDPESGLAQALHFEDGLGRARVRDCAIGENDIWLATDNGLFRYRQTGALPSIEMESMSSDRLHALNEPLEKTTDTPRLRFEFHTVPPSLTTTPSLFRHRMKGYSDWQYTTNSFADFNDLPAGSYQFELQAVDRDFGASEVLSTPVTITVPYRRYALTGAAMGFAVIAAGLLFWTFVRTRSENSRLSAEVTERVEKEVVLMEQLVDSQRLESIGTVAAGIAHDFNNSLQVISLNTELALCRLDSREPEQVDASRELLGLVGDASHQASTLARSLLTFGRQAEQHRKRVLIGEFLDNTLKMIRHVLPPSIDTSFEWSDVTKEWFWVDTTQISQVITNLSFNARDAMPEGGRLEIHASVTERDNVRYARILVRDSGEGIAPENISKIFDPFYTSKAREHGTGLGLSIVHGIVSAHQGTIQVESAVGIGTSIEFLLPSLGQCEPESSPETKKLIRRFDGSHAKIAVADDKRAVRDSIRSVLGDCNYDVIEFQNGEEVIEQLDTIKSEVAAVILNVDMPRRSGRSVWKTLRSIGYAGRIVLISGYPEQLPSPIDENTRCLSKPFTNAEMLQALATSPLPAAPHLGDSRATT